MKSIANSEVSSLAFLIVFSPTLNSMTITTWPNTTTASMRRLRRRMSNSGRSVRD